MIINGYIGCSGFFYREWKNHFYPEKLPQKQWFEYYSQNFNTLEINASFYKFPTENSLARWYDASPGQFKFSIKAPRLISHYKKFVDCDRLLNDFYHLATKGLKEKLGCVLYQLPPQLSFSPEKLALITGCVDKNLKNVFEFRHESWWTEEVFDQFKKHQLIFSGISHPLLPDQVIKTADEIYYRFHGVPSLYKSAYKENFIRKIYRDIVQAKPSAFWTYFNNTSEMGAINNALFMQKLAGSTTLHRHSSGLH